METECAATAAPSLERIPILTHAPELLPALIRMCWSMLTFILWCLLLVICWPLALLALVLYPLVWLLLLPFRLLGITVSALLDLVWTVVTLPARILRRLT